MFDSILDAFYYVIHKLYDGVTYPQAVVLYNQYLCSENNVEDKIMYIANKIKQKENDK